MNSQGLSVLLKKQTPVTYGIKSRCLEFCPLTHLHRELGQAV